MAEFFHLIKFLLLPIDHSSLHDNYPCLLMLTLRNVPSATPCKKRKKKKQERMGCQKLVLFNLNLTLFHLTGYVLVLFKRLLLWP